MPTRAWAGGGPGLDGFGRGRSSTRPTATPGGAQHAGDRRQPGDGAIGAPRSRKLCTQTDATLRQVGEEHFNLISALHKSCAQRRGRLPLRAGQDMFSGEDPLYIARRLVRFARGLSAGRPPCAAVALRAKEAFEFLGLPRDLPWRRAPLPASAPRATGLMRPLQALKRSRSALTSRSHADPNSVPLDEGRRYGRMTLTLIIRVLDDRHGNTPESSRAEQYYEREMASRRRSKKLDWWLKVKDKIRSANRD